MEIKSTLTNRAGQVLDVVYRDLQSLEELGEKEKDISAVTGFCFCGDKIINRIAVGNLLYNNL